MTPRAISLMDVLAPPGNDWLKEISRSRTNLPAGVRIVRFGDGDEELVTEDDGVAAKRRQPRKAAA